MDRYLLVALFGAAGAVSRYAVDTLFGSVSPGQFPWSTLVVNVVGAFALGVLIELGLRGVLANPNWRIALGVGFLGAFTTFSTFGYQTIQLIEDGHVTAAGLNVLLSVTIGLLAAWGGLTLGRVLF